MSKTLLNGVNEVLKKTDVLDSDAGLLTTLTDSARQTLIDTTVQAINEIVDELYVLAKMSKPKQMRESTITLSDGVKKYSLHSKLLMLRTEYHLIDETNSHTITIIPDGYHDIVLGDLDQDDTGLPHFCAISPIDGKLVMDRAPTSVEAGRVYKYRYDRDLSLDEADDVFPFNDAVFRSVVTGAAERYKFYRHLEFSDGIYRRAMSMAARYLREMPPRTSYGRGRSSHNITDPLADGSST